MITVPDKEPDIHTLAPPQLSIPWKPPAKVFSHLPLITGYETHPQACTFHHCSSHHYNDLIAVSLT